VYSREEFLKLEQAKQQKEHLKRMAQVALEPEDEDSMHESK
jgi:hypothetical protein